MLTFRNWCVGLLAASWLLAATAIAADQPPPDRSRLDRIQKELQSEIPRLLCLDESIATGGQPTAQAYAKAAASGFRSVLSLRTKNEGIDLALERTRVESHRMRYFNIPVDSSSPRPEQADEFLRVVSDPANHPMLINCATANRVGAFMMIFRVVEQGWSEEKALEEALKIGLRGEALRKFAKDFIAQSRAKQS